MRQVRLWGVGALGAALLATSGCAHNTYAIAQMSPGELRGVSDAGLCEAQRYWQSANLSNEIRSRRLDCSTGLRTPPPRKPTAKKPKTPSKPASGVAVGTVSPASATGRAGAPVDLDSATPAGRADRAPVDLDAVATPVPGSGPGGAVDLDAEAE